MYFDELLYALLIVGVSFLMYLSYIVISANKSKRRSRFSVQQSCSSDQCVRCSRYDIVLAEALHRFKKFSITFGDDGLDRISAYFEDHNGLFATSLQKPNVLYVPGLRASPLWTDNDVFSRELKLLERHWIEILDEFKCVFHRLDIDSSGWNRNSTDNGEWLVFCLYNQGERIIKNCLCCPKTTSIIESMSSFMRSNLFGNVMFSVIQPNSTVAEHYGPCNVRIRCHLGLDIPNTGSKLMIAGQNCDWHNGCCLFMDDSFCHGAVNNGSEPRVILIVDLWHPDLTIKERNAINAVFPTTC